MKKLGAISDNKIKGERLIYHSKSNKRFKYHTHPYQRF
jgi:hypothetical protein